MQFDHFSRRAGVSCRPQQTDPFYPSATLQPFLGHCLRPSGRCIGPGLAILELRPADRSDGANWRHANGAEDSLSDGLRALQHARFRGSGVCPALWGHHLALAAVLACPLLYHQPPCSPLLSEIPVSRLAFLRPCALAASCKRLAACGLAAGCGTAAPRPPSSPPPHHLGRSLSSVSQPKVSH